MPEQGNHDSPPKFTRRRVLQFAGAAAASAAAGRAAKYLEVSRSQHPSPPQETPVNNPPAPETAPTAHKTPEHQVSVRTFPDSQTEAIAQQLELSAGSFFDVDDHAPESYTAYKSYRLLPVFHPAVLAQKDLIYSLSDTYEVPPNTIATIMAIESGGDPNAKSEAGATGLFQLMPQFHLQDVPESQYNDPRTNGDRAMQYFVQCLSDARSYLESANPGKTYVFQHPDIFLRAYAIYNAGAENAKDDFNNLIPETKEYVRIANRLFKTMEIAQKQRESGMTDEQIVENLCSPEVDARAKGLEAMKNAGEKLDDALRYFSAPSVPAPASPAEQQGLNNYTEYKNGRIAKYDYPLNPALRISERFIYNVPTNNDIKNWLAIDTSRTQSSTT